MPPTASAAAAPWLPLFLRHISALSSPTFSLSTIHPLDPPTSSSPASPSVPSHVPRVRYCIHRGIWAAKLPDHKYENPAKRNKEGVWESDMMVFTTDARMSKAADFFNVPGQELATEEEMKSSGGGGPVEACWWVEEVSAQWRVKGTAWILASDMDGQGIGAEKVKKELGRRMRKVGTEEDAKGWSWGREVTAHFGNLSPGMRGSFRQPDPGTSAPAQPAQPSDPDRKLGRKLEDIEDKLARKNFRVVVIRPDEVERIDLSDPSISRRYTYRWVEDEGAEGKWSDEEILWP